MTRMEPGEPMSEEEVFVLFLFACIGGALLLCAFLRYRLVRRLEKECVDRNNVAAKELTKARLAWNEALDRNIELVNAFKANDEHYVFLSRLNCVIIRKFSRPFFRHYEVKRRVGGPVIVGGAKSLDDYRQILELNDAIVDAVDRYNECKDLKDRQRDFLYIYDKIIKIMGHQSRAAYTNLVAYVRKYERVVNIKRYAPKPIRRGNVSIGSLSD